MAERFTLKIGNHLLSSEKKKYYNEKVFSEIAPKYDFITRALSFWNDAAWKLDLINALPANTNPHCIDLACGTGDISFLLAKKYPDGYISGIDIAEPMLEIAGKRNIFPNIHFIKQDMSHLDYSSQSVDIVTGGYALRNAPDLGVVLDEIHRILKPGGTAAFLDFSKPDSKFSQKLEYWILKIWGGFWGIMLHGNYEVYSYIAESLRLFPDRLQLREILWRKGFLVTTSRQYFFGITELMVVKKVAE